MSWTPVDTEAAEFAKLTLSQIALMFGLPVSMLGGPSGNSLDYSTTELRMIELYQLSLLPWIRRIETVLDAQLPRDTELRIEVDGLLRADTKTRLRDVCDRHRQRDLDGRRGAGLGVPSAATTGECCCHD